MAEEKKKGWFQKFKAGLFGEKEEIKPVVTETPVKSLPDNEITEQKVQDKAPDIIPTKQDTSSIEVPQVSIDSTFNSEASIKETIDKSQIEDIKNTIEFTQDKKLSDSISNESDNSEALNNIDTIISNTEYEKENLSDTISLKEEIITKDIKDQDLPLEDTKNSLVNIAEETALEEKTPEEKKLEDKDSQPSFQNIPVKKKDFNLKSLDISDITNKPKVEPIIEKTTTEESVAEEVIEVVEEKTTQPEEEKKGWFSKVIDTLNSPIEIKLETSDGDDSLMSKLKGNISIGLGKPVVRETSEEREAWRAKLRERLASTRGAFTEKLERLMHGRTSIDDELLEEIEEILLESDVGVEMTDKISEKLRSLAKEKRFLPAEVMPSLFDYLKAQISMEEERIVIDEDRLNIIVMVGVNGTGKTTTTGKIAAKLAISEYSVILAAADTFRAAAIEQLEVWSKRADVPLVKHQEGSDAAAVVHDAIASARAKKANVLLIDTAGRLHNKAHLMDELKKIRRIIDKEAPEAKLEVLLVLDATTGQNGLSQAMVFADAVQLTGVVLTKLDGTAKGGVIFSIKNSLKLPIKLVGVGESLDDLRDFQPQIFVDALFSEKSENLIEQSTKMRS